MALEAKKLARIVLFRRLKQIRVKPSNSSNLMLGGGLMGSSLITLLSTSGGGRKFALPTFIKWLTREYS